MDRKKIGKRLEALRVPLYPKIADFTERTGIKHPQIRDTEAGLSFLRIDLMEKWVKACGRTLSSFFAEIEAEEDGKAPRPPSLEEQALQQFKIFSSADPEVGLALIQILNRVARKTPPSKHK